MLLWGIGYYACLRQSSDVTLGKSDFSEVISLFLFSGSLAIHTGCFVGVFTADVYNSCQWELCFGNVTCMIFHIWQNQILQVSY